MASVRNPDRVELHVAACDAFADPALAVRELSWAAETLGLGAWVALDDRHDNGEPLSLEELVRAENDWAWANWPGPWYLVPRDAPRKEMYVGIGPPSEHPMFGWTPFSLLVVAVPSPQSNARIGELFDAILERWQIAYGYVELLTPNSVGLGNYLKPPGSGIIRGTREVVFSGWLGQVEEHGVPALMAWHVLPAAAVERLGRDLVDQLPGSSTTLENGTTLVRLVDRLEDLGELAERRPQAYRILGPDAFALTFPYDDIRSRCSEAELYGWADRARDPGGS